MAMSGVFASPANFDGITLVPNPGGDAFVAGLTTDGHFNWAQQITAAPYSGYRPTAYDLSMDSAGNMYVIGGFGAPTCFGNICITNYGPHGGFVLNGFVARYSSDGVPRWVQTLQCNGIAGFSGVALDSTGNAYVAGTFSNRAVLNGVTVTNASGTASLVAKLDSEGVPQWMQVFGDNNVFINRLWVDDATNVLIGGWFSGTQSFGDFTLTRTNVTGFFAKMANQAGPPVIFIQPLSQIALATGDVSLRVSAYGAQPLSFQWLHSAVPVPGGTNANLLLPAVQVGQDGAYGVIITNAFGAVTSRVANLSIVTPLTTRTAESGTTVEFSARAGPASPVQYQWFFNGTSLGSQATNETLQLANVQSSQAGAYRVVITAPLGAQTNLSASLSVIPPVPRTSVPGLLVSGQVGMPVQVSSTDGLGPVTHWQAQTNFVLRSTSQYYFDLSDSLPSAHFYRAYATNGSGPAPGLGLKIILHSP
jgi:hypothetical protein